MCGESPEPCLQGASYCNVDPKLENLCGMVFGVADCRTGIHVTSSRIAVCGHAVDTSRCTDGTDLKSDTPTVCDVPVDMDPCEPGQAGCDLLKECTGGYTLAAGEAAGEICGIPTDPSVCQRFPAACDLIIECTGGTVRSESAGPVTVCGEEVDPCTIQLVCELDCLESLAAMPAGESADAETPEEITVCGKTFPVPCKEGVDLSTWSVCGKEWDPCSDSQQCELPCSEELMYAAAASQFADAYDANPEPAIEWDGTNRHVEVCGYEVGSDCDHSVSTGGGGITFTGSPGAVNQLLYSMSGLLHWISIDSCKLEPCDPGPDGRYDNGDCPCMSAPPTIFDWDGDWSLNQFDVDDDCDHLGDDLDDAISFLKGRNQQDQWWLMTPHGVDVEIWIAVDGLNWLTSDYAKLGERNGIGVKDSEPDPYLHAFLDTTGTGTPVRNLEFKAEGSIPGFSKASHPWNVGYTGANQAEFTWPQSTSNSDWSTNFFAMDGFSPDFTDPSWKDRPNGAFTIPEIDFHIDLLEDDNNSPNRGADDFIASTNKEILLDRLADPYSATSLVKPNIRPWTNFGSLAEIQLEVGTNINNCALTWAEMIMQNPNAVVNHMGQACEV